MRRTAITVCVSTFVLAWLFSTALLAGTPGLPDPTPAFAITTGFAVAAAYEIPDAAAPRLTLESAESDDRDDWDDDDDDDGPCWRCKRRRRAQGGGGGGITFGYLNANFEVINAKVREMGIPQLSEDIFLIGGRGYGRVGCLILGGGGYGGWTETSGIPDCCSRQVRAELGYGGFIVGLNKGTDWVEGTLGTLIGGGGVQFIRKRNSRSVADWDGAWDPFSEDTGDSVSTDDLNITSNLTGYFFALEPYFELRAWVLPWMSLDFAASYLWARVNRGQWKVDDVKIPDSPETNIGGMSFKFTLNFGA